MSQQDEFDVFGGDTGLKDDYDGVIVDAWFASDPKYGDNLLLFMKKRDEATGEEVEDRYGCGADWASYDGGITVEHPKDQPERVKRFNTQTAYYEMFSSAVKVGAEEEMRNRAKAMPDADGRVVGPRNAEIWKGLRFHWGVKTETINMTDRKTGERIERNVSRSLPTAYLGVNEEIAGATTTSGSSNAGAVPPTSSTSSAETIPAPTPAAQTEPAPTPTPQSVPTNNPAGLSPEQTAQLKVLAAANPYPAFVDAVMALDNGSLLNNMELMTALGDESFYASLKS